MTGADETVDRAADKLDATAERAARRGGIAARLAQPLADDATFLRKLKPSLMKARLRGDLPTDGRPTSAPPVAPAGPQIGARRRAGGVNPFLVAGGALASGILIAKLIDWRSHAHPRN